MTIPVQNPVVEYEFTGPGEYEFDFYIMAANNLVVQHYVENESILTLIEGQDYTVDFTEDGPGKITVTYDPPDYGVLRIMRETDKAQKTDYVNGGPFDQELLEKDLDRIYMILQELKQTFEVTGITNWRGVWRPQTAYSAHDAVSGPEGTKFEYSIFTAVTDHVSSDNFEDDFTAGLWRLSFDMVDLTVLLEEAKQAMEESCACRDKACQCAQTACQCKTDAEQASYEAEQYAISAGEAVSLADASAVCAQKWASEDEDVPIDCGGRQGYSAYHWAQKAGAGGITTITSSDPDVCVISEPDPRTRHLTFNLDQASGLPKLDQNGKIKLEQLPVMGLQFYGGFIGHDNCPKDYSNPPETSCTEPDYRNPSELWPSVTFPNGSYFIITSPTPEEDPGHVNVVNHDGSGQVAVLAGDAIIFKDGSQGEDAGWYHVPEVVKGGDIAANILFDDSNTVIKGTNLQVWCENADAALSGKVNRSGDTMTGDLEIDKDSPALKLVDTGQSSFRIVGDNTNLEFFRDSNQLCRMGTDALAYYGSLESADSEPSVVLNNTNLSGTGSMWRSVVDYSGNYKVQYWNGVSWTNLFIADPDTGLIDFNFDIDSPNWGDGGGGGTECVCQDTFKIVGSQPLAFWEKEGTNRKWAMGCDGSTWAFGFSTDGGSDWTATFFVELDNYLTFKKSPKIESMGTTSDCAATKGYVDNEIAKIPQPSNYFSNFVSVYGNSEAAYELKAGNNAQWRIATNEDGLAFGTSATAWMYFNSSGIYCGMPFFCTNMADSKDAVVTKGYVDKEITLLMDRIAGLEERLSGLEERLSGLEEKVNEKA